MTNVDQSENSLESLKRKPAISLKYVFITDSRFLTGHQITNKKNKNK